MNPQTTYVSNSPIHRFVTMFLLALGVVLIGLYMGQFVPRALFLPLIIVEFIFLFMMIFARKRKAVGYPLMFSFMLISGLTLYPALSMYVSTLGAEAVVKAFGIAVVSFVGVAMYAAKTKEDFSFLGGFLTVGVFALIGVAIIQFFVPFTGTMQMIYSSFGILIFLGFTIFDINRIARYGFSEEEIPMLVVSIYLDFINLFLFILRFFSSDDK